MAVSDKEYSNSELEIFDSIPLATGRLTIYAKKCVFVFQGRQSNWTFLTRHVKCKLVSKLARPTVDTYQMHLLNVLHASHLVAAVNSLISLFLPCRHNFVRLPSHILTEALVPFVSPLPVALFLSSLICNTTQVIRRGKNS